MKKALISSTTAYMLHQFCKPNIEILQDMGYQVEVACNFGKESPMSAEVTAGFREYLAGHDVKVHEVDCPNRPNQVKRIVGAYHQFKQLADEEDYSIVHTQTPIGGVLCRLGFKNARSRGTKVIYQAHGFHFFDGAPLVNWIVYYPIEKWCSRYTDVLITINCEDYERAKAKLHAKKTVYIPGVGVDVKKFSGRLVDRSQKRKELGIPEGSLALLSVGELNDNKNLDVVIRALGKLKCEARLGGLIYLIVGIGSKQEDLQNLAIQEGVEDVVHLLGFRTDVSEIMEAVDAFVYPSFREGLPVALMEAMAAGLPVAVSRARGCRDLIDEDEGGSLFDSNDEDSVAKALECLVNASADQLTHYGGHNKLKVRTFDTSTVKTVLEALYAQTETERGVAAHLNTALNARELRMSLGYTDDDLVLLSVGELSVRKNHVAVIRALTQIPDKRVKYVVVGQGELSDYLLEEAARLDISDRVQLLGYRSDVRDLMQAADVFVFPSLQEGLPVALMEAMAAGLPCVASDIRGNSDLLKIDNELQAPGQGTQQISSVLFSSDIQLFDIENADSLASSIQSMASLSEENRVSLGVHNHNAVLGHDVGVVELALEQVYSSTDEMLSE